MSSLLWWGFSTACSALDIPMQRSGMRFLAEGFSILVSFLHIQYQCSCCTLTVKWTVISHFRISLQRRRLILLGPWLRLLITAIWWTPQPNPDCLSGQDMSQVASPILEFSYSECTVIGFNPKPDCQPTNRPYRHHWPTHQDFSSLCSHLSHLHLVPFPYLCLLFLPVAWVEKQMFMLVSFFLYYKKARL